MTLLKKIIIAVMFFIFYIGVGYAAQMSLLPLMVRHFLMAWQFTLLLLVLLCLIFYAVRSVYKNRHLESLLLLILSIIFSVFMIPVSLRMMHHYGSLAFKAAKHATQSESLEQRPAVDGIMELYNQKEFDQYVAKSFVKPVVIKVSALWCPPCQQLKPIYKKIAEELHEKIEFAAIDIDLFENSRILSIQSVPTLLYYKNGQEAARNSGFKTAEELKTELQNLL